MGCGASKRSVQVRGPSILANEKTHSDVGTSNHKSEYNSNLHAHASGTSGSQKRGGDVEIERNKQRHFVENSPAQADQQTKLDQQTTSADSILHKSHPTEFVLNNEIDYPPLPPQSTKEELLTGKRELMADMDNYAERVKPENTAVQTINDFTNQILEPISKYVPINGSVGINQRNQPLTQQHAAAPASGSVEGSSSAVQSLVDATNKSITPRITKSVTFKENVNSTSSDQPTPGADGVQLDGGKDETRNADHETHSDGASNNTNSQMPNNMVGGGTTDADHRINSADGKPPGGLRNEKTNVVVAESGSDPHDGVDGPKRENHVGNDPQISSKPSKTTTELTPEEMQERVRSQMAELKEQQEREKEARSRDKIRQQLTLKEKLNKRKEMKKNKLTSDNRTDTSLTTTTTTTTHSSYDIPSPGEKSEAEGSIEPAEQVTPEVVVAHPVAKEETVPSPVAPVTKKENVYNKEDISLFQDLEHHAVNMERLTSSDVTFEALMQTLLIHELSDLEKARILFHWVTVQDLNQTSFPPDTAPDTPLGYLRDIKNDEKRYATLYMRLCQAASLHAKEITGYLKGVGYIPDYKFTGMEDPFRGSWNAVLIDGQWRLIDTHWGARHVVETDDDTTSRHSLETVYKYEEHYFITDPENLINTHFPDDPAWQLLHHPVTLAQFESFPKQWPLFYKLGLRQQSHECGVITADASGHLRMCISTGTAPATFRAELRTRERKTTTTSGHLLQRHVLHYRSDNLEVVELFLPISGSFLLKIFGCSPRYSDDDSTFTNVCLFQINCAEISPTSTGPKMMMPTVTTFYGLSQGARDFGAVGLTPEDAKATTDERGEARISVLIKRPEDEFIEFSQNLFDVNDMQPPDRCLQTTRRTDSGDLELVIRVRAPTNGNYALVLYENRVQGSQNLASFASFLITCTALPDGCTTPPYPSVVNNRLGILQPNDLKLKLSCVFPKAEDECEVGWVKTNAQGEAMLIFEHPQQVTFMATPPDPAGGVVVSNNFETSSVLVRISHAAAAQQKEYMLKLYGAVTGTTDQCPLVFSALIQVPPEFNAPSNSLIDSLPDCPMNNWGTIKTNFTSHGMRLDKFVNCAPLSEKMFGMTGNSDLDEKIQNTPCRGYDGDGDIEIHISLTKALPVKCVLKLLDRSLPPEQKHAMEHYSFVQKNDQTSLIIRARCPRSGPYSLAIYGGRFGDEGLSPVYLVLIMANAPSSADFIFKQPFPATFGIWSTSLHHLEGPLNVKMKAGTPTTIKLQLAKYQNDDAGGSTPKAYPRVMLLVNRQKVVDPDDKPDELTYVWTYTPQPGEQVVAIACKMIPLVEQVSLVLQFEVEER